MYIFRKPSVVIWPLALSSTCLEVARSTESVYLFQRAVSNAMLRSSVILVAEF
ncbi:hypothetical protein MTR_6g071915 [Medicago truncatula]|uniref:Uncharacterized protein n=1 Tax=Medicago truncatula TaxID=3880 RepID=G7KIE9_MEDTR|nr:hypothetical protein MTR_6g072280 [Medicago truncatula]KEH26765.1 hypothetical protein MTR_6g071915 [Medicago truncatula]